MNRPRRKLTADMLAVLEALHAAASIPQPVSLAEEVYYDAQAREAEAREHVERANYHDSTWSL